MQWLFRRLAEAQQKATEHRPELRAELSDIRNRLAGLEAERAAREAEHLEVQDRLIRLMKRVQSRLTYETKTEKAEDNGLARFKFGGR